ncbi:hypothetical protein UlMin_018857 [Ulmus minor]
MGEVQELQLTITTQEAMDANSHEQTSDSNQSHVPHSGKYTRWLRVFIYATFVIFGQATATLLGRLYYDKGGKSKWMATLVQLAGFPLLLPYYFSILATKKNRTNRTIIRSKRPSFSTLASIYIALGIFIAGDCYLYSVGLLYLPVSTFSLICASQLAFNAIFSFFLNSQKFTPYIINSLVLLTISSVLLVFQSSSEENHKSSKAKYAIGFICTLCASAGYGLVLSSTQFFIQKVIKRVTFSVIIDLLVFESIVATLAILVGLFASQEWKDLNEEMNLFELGKVSYVMTLAWTAIVWQVFAIGSVGLIVEVSSLFSNVISVLGLPVVPVLSIFFFQEKMDGLKATAMVLAIWGFISYAYQNYLDSYDSKTQNRDSNEETRASE